MPSPDIFGGGDARSPCRSFTTTPSPFALRWPISDYDSIDILRFPDWMLYPQKKSRSGDSDGTKKALEEDTLRRWQSRCELY